MAKHLFGTIPLVALATLLAWLFAAPMAHAQYPGPQGAIMFSSNCAASPMFGTAFECYDTTNQALYHWSGTAFVPSPNATVVGSLPACGAGQLGLQQVVTDSTTVSAEGQTCVGSSTNKALAVCLGSTWKCF